MKIFVVFGQNKQNYEGEYAPEALACIDEVGNDTNPDYLLEKLDEYRRDSRFESVQVVPIEVNSSDVMDILYPPQTFIKGKVLKS